MRLDHLLSKEQHWPHARAVSRVSPFAGAAGGVVVGGVQVGSCRRRMFCGWVCSLVEHWLFGSPGWFQADVSTARRLRWGSGKPFEGAWSGGRSHCWVLRERAPRLFGCGVRCLQTAPKLLTWSVGGVRACGPVRPPYHIVVPPGGDVRVLAVGGVVVVWWWRWVGGRSCFENCIVNASIL